MKTGRFIQYQRCYEVTAICPYCDTETTDIIFGLAPENICDICCGNCLTEFKIETEVNKTNVT
jgi:hypothetical protein